MPPRPPGACARARGAAARRLVKAPIPRLRGQAVLNFAGHVILNAARLWTEFSSDQKQRLQKVLFPQGVTFAEGIYKTAETALFFKLLQESEGQKTGLATLTGIEPVHPP